MRKTLSLLILACIIPLFIQAQSAPAVKSVLKKNTEESKDALPTSGPARSNKQMNGATENPLFENPLYAPDDWIKHCDGPSFNGVGSGNPEDFIVAARWTPEDLTELGIAEGDVVSKIKFVPYDITITTFTLHIYQGSVSLDNPGTLMYEQVVTQPLISGEDNIVELNKPYFIDVDQEIWIGYRVVSSGGFPAGYDATERVQDKGNLMYWYGMWSNVYSLTRGNVAGNWNIEAFISEGNLKQAVTPTDFTVTPIGMDLVADLAWTNPSLNIDGGALTGITKIVLERNDVLVKEFDNPEVGGRMEYTDNEVPETGNYTYKVYAVTADGGVGISTIAIAPIGEICPIVFNFWDSCGNGWSESYINIKVDGEDYGNITMSGGFFTTISMPLPLGDVEFSWISGWVEYENYFEIRDVHGILIFEWKLSETGPAEGVFYTYTHTCAEPEYATISGVVTGVNDEPIEGATIAFTGTFNPVLTSDAEGKFSIDLPLWQLYDIRVTADGYETIYDPFNFIMFDTTKSYGMMEKKPETLGLSVEANGPDAHFSWNNKEKVEVSFYEPDVEFNDLTAMYQVINVGYGIVCDLTDYPDAVIAEMDYHHLSWGIDGVWDYKVYVADLTDKIIAYESDILKTTVNDDWETGISLGNITGLGGKTVGIFVEPMSGPSGDCLPNLTCDGKLEHTSSYQHFNFSTFVMEENVYGVGDYLMNLWIETGAGDRKNVSKSLQSYEVFLNGEPQGMTSEEYWDFTGLANGEYTAGVQGIYETGSSSMKTINFVIGGNKIADIGNETIALYPNPAIDFVNVKGDNIIAITVFDAVGRRMTNYANTSKIDVSSYKAGVYFFEIATSTGDVKRTKLLIK